MKTAVTAGTVLAQGLGRGGDVGRARAPGRHSVFPLQGLVLPFVSGDTETQREAEIPSSFIVRQEVSQDKRGLSVPWFSHL